jgi:1-aminocyclopropane-1-carboxylate deaminase/D-cysteine desulfhydrase-like pyridoxal-dependent ACC family enzyme
MDAEVILKKSDNRSREDQFEELRHAVHDKYEPLGEVIYDIPVGGSNTLGVLGYYECACELTQQAEELGIRGSRVVVPVGSMGTYIGLFGGLKNENSSLSLTGIAIAPSPEHPRLRAAEFYKEMKAAYDLAYSPAEEEFDIRCDYDFGGYNNPVKEVREAIYMMGRHEAIILDPCYTGKAFAGLVAMVREEKLRKGETVIFVHTGGMPGINTPFHRAEFERELKNGVKIIKSSDLNES